MHTGRRLILLGTMVAIVVMSLVMAPDVQAGETIQLVAYEYPPYYADVSLGTLGHGFISDLVIAAFSAVEIEAKISYQPVLRSIQSFKNGNFVAYVGSKEVLFSLLEPDDVESTYLCTYYLLFNYFRSQIPDTLSYTKFTDLGAYTIGDIVGTQEPLAEAGLTVELAPTLEQSMKKLAAGRIDLWVAVGVTAYYLINTHLPERLSDLTYVAKPLGQGSVDISFLKKHQDAARMKTLFGRGMEIIRENEVCTNILTRYFGEGLGEGLFLEDSLPSCQ